MPTPTVPVKKKLVKSEDLAGLQALGNQVQAQAEAGEIDASLIEKLTSAINIAVDQAGDPVNERADELAGDAGAQAAPPAPTPAPAAPEAPDDDDLNKRSPLAAAPPPVFYVQGGYEDDMRAKLPDFIKALDSGSVRAAQRITGTNQQVFDVMFNMACKALLTEGGFVYKNIRALNAAAPNPDEMLNKAITSGNYPGIYLMRLAKLMMPLYAGLRRRIATQTPTTGSDQAQWKTQIGFQNLSRAAAMVVAEAGIGQTMNETPLSFATAFRDLTLNDSVTLKSTAASRGFDDPLQIAVMRTMTALLELEERKLIGDNYAAISKPASCTATGTGTGSIGNSTDKFIVSALTYRGWLAGSTGSASAIGETDGTLSDAVDLSGKAGVTVTWPAVKGAVAYNLFYNPASHATNKYYIGTYTANSVALTSLPSSGNAPSASNVSANSNGWEGLISWGALSTIYGNAIPGKVAMVDNAGAALTTGSSGVTQIDSVLANLWTQWQIAPTLMVMSANTVGHLTDKILALNSGAMYRIEVSQERGTMQGGAFVTGYVNKFAPYSDGTPRYIDVMPHPYFPDGMIQFLCETIPYPTSREARGFALDTLIPYTYFPLASVDLSYPFAMTVSEVPECFHPAAQVVLAGIKVS